MRDKTADPKFLLQKKIESKFANLFPEKWIPYIQWLVLLQYRIQSLGDRNASGGFDAKYYEHT